MKVKVIFFASLRDAVGTGTETVELAGDAASVAQVREALIAKGEVWAHAFRNLKRIRAAVNQELAGDDANIIFGAMYDDTYTDEASITVMMQSSKRAMKSPSSRR